MSYIFSFSSRNNAMRFCDAVRAYGGRAQLVNTPQSMGSGCGLSVKCADYELCRGVLGRGSYELGAVYAFDGAGYRHISETIN